MKHYVSKYDFYIIHNSKNNIYIAENDIIVSSLRLAKEFTRKPKISETMRQQGFNVYKCKKHTEVYVGVSY